MAFTPKDWKNYPDTTTPITAEALEDLEDRVTDYATPPIDWTNNTTSAALAVTQATNASASISTGGAIRITNTLSTGVGLLVYSAQASPSGRLAVINAAHTAFNQSALRIEHSGSGRGLDVNQSGTGIGANIVASGGGAANAHALAVSLANAGSTTSSAISASSSNADHSAVQVTGVESGRGTIKISHVKPTGVDDTNASGLSIDLAGAGTAAQGIFIDSSATTTGKLINARVGGSDRFVVTAGGAIQARGIQITTEDLSPVLGGTGSITGTVNINCFGLADSVYAAVLGANVTIAVSNLAAWSTLTLHLKQAAATTYTVTLAKVGGSVLKPLDVDLAMTTATSAVNVYTIYGAPNGTDMVVAEPIKGIT